MNSRRLLKAVKVLAFVFVAIQALAFLTMNLWNWLMPEIFGLRQLTYIQALGLLILAKILFGGFHRHGGGRGPGWRRHMEDRFANMTPEERERFRSGMSNRRGWCRPTPAEPTGQPTL